jgi:LytR cell envelope-related transcriptional attenuator
VSDNGPRIPGWGTPQVEHEGDVDPFAPPTANGSGTPAPHQEWYPEPAPRSSQPPAPAPGPADATDSLDDFFGPAEPETQRSPFAGPPDPVAYAAMHHEQHEVEWASTQLGERGAGTHRRRQASRYILPAAWALVVLAIAIGIIGWVRDGQQPAAAPSPSPAQNSAPSAASIPSPSASLPSVASTVPSASTAPTSAASTISSSTPPAAVAPVVTFAPAIILNETVTRGLAASVAAHLRSLGWHVTGVGNWHGEVPVTTVYYPSGYLAAAQSLARALHTTRVRPIVAGMLPGHVTAVLTGDPYG